MQAPTLRSAGASPAPMTAPPRISVDTVDSEARFAQLANEWNRVHELAGAASPVNAWAWLFEWWRAYGAGRRLNILTARADGKLCAVLPLYVETQRALGMPVRVARLLGCGGDTYPDDLGPIFDPAHEAEAADALAAETFGATAWDVLLLEDMDSKAPFGAFAEAFAARRGLRTLRAPAQPIVYIDLPATWEGYLSQLSRNRRSKVRSQRKKLHTLTKARFFVWDDPATIDAGFDRLAELHHKRWDEAGEESTSFRSREYLGFHRAVMRMALLRGALRLYALEINGEVAAMLYALRFRRGIFLVQAGFDPAWRELRAGLVLLGHAIQHAVEEGNEIFDFLRGTHSYKDHFASSLRHTETVTVSKGTIAARAWKLVRQTLPALKKRLKALLSRRASSH
jgi:CelD/BcsL family acetyltransferase involved in cellulose biosynthesis